MKSLIEYTRNNVSTNECRVRLEEPDKSSKGCVENFLIGWDVNNVQIYDVWGWDYALCSGTPMKSYRVSLDDKPHLNGFLKAHMKHFVQEEDKRFQKASDF